MKKRWKYLQLQEKSLQAIHSTIDCFNRVYDPYKIETCLILMTNAWELLGKAILVKIKGKKSIQKDKHGNTISAEQIITKLQSQQLLDENQADCIQQVISLRNHACHNHLPPIPDEILHHLFYFGCKFYKDLTAKQFPKQAKIIKQNFLSVSFDDLTTYAEKVQSLVGRMKRNKQDMQLVWLLERGVRFDGMSYVSQEQFERQYKNKRKVLPHLEVNKFIKNSDMVRIVPVQAPKNFTADITLRKGKPTGSSLPVFIKKTDVENDYPYLTGEIALKLGKDQNYVAYAFKKLNYKGNTHYHQPVRASKSGTINRYSEAALNGLKQKLASDPAFNPYK